MTLAGIANELKANNARVILLFAFNAVGKTQLSVAFKDTTKQADGSHTGVYYNAYSEDLFVWNNDEEHDGADLRLTVLPSSLSRFHAQLGNEDSIRTKLKAYRPTYDFRFKMHDDAEDGLEYIYFFIPDPNPEVTPPHIKISRGEERIFVWCFFLALFEVEGWAGHQSAHFFIDDPVSSLDDHNIFITAFTLFDLIEKHHEQRKIIITTHHIGLYCILKDWLTRGEKAQTFIVDRNDRTKDRAKGFILQRADESFSLERDNKEVMLYHLKLLQVLIAAKDTNGLRAYHCVLLRQALENIASFHGRPKFSFVLQHIGVEDANDVAFIVNMLSHKTFYTYESDLLQDRALQLVSLVITKLQETYKFELH